VRGGTAGRRERGEDALQNADILGATVVPADPDSLAPIETDVPPRRLEPQHQSDQPEEHPRGRGPWDHTHVERAVERRGAGGQQEEASVRFHVGHGDQSRVVRDRSAVDLHLEGADRGAREPPDGRAVV
jgi:hypothetical protein